MTTVFGKPYQNVLTKMKNSENSHVKPHETSPPTPDSYAFDVDIVEVTTILPRIMDDHDSDIALAEPEYNFPPVRHKESMTSTVVSSVNNSISVISLKEEDNNDKTICSISEYMDTFSDADNCCIGKDIMNCIGLQRIVSILSFYNANYNKYNALNQYLSKYNMKAHLMNDFHHVLDKHLNEDHISKRKVQKQFEMIYREMMEINHLFCKISTCDIWIRNHRTRETMQIDCGDSKLAVFIDLMDTIHCYFMHSVDIGHRLINDDYNKYMTDINMAHLRSYLRLHTAKVVFVEDTRFITNLRHRKKEMSGYLRKESLYLKQIRLRYIVLRDNHLYSYKTDAELELTECIDLNEYSHVQICVDGTLGEFELVSVDNNHKTRVFIASSLSELDEWLCVLKGVMSVDCSTNNEFGERFDYWSNDSSYPKYESMKEELTQNTLYSLSILAFECAFSKAIHLLDCHLIRNMMSCRDVIDKYNIRYDATPRIDHILSLVLWCDYRLISMVFTEQFNRISKKMYDELWIWSKFLIESVNAFGGRLKKSKHKTCYHLMNNNNVNFLENLTLFNGAISSTTQPSVILQKVGAENGIVLELTNYKKLRYFNCSFISYFATENERLFVQPPFLDKHCNYYFNILSIYNLAENEGYREYILALNILKMLFNNCLIDMDAAAQCIDIIKYLISILLADCGGIQCPEYVTSALNEWSDSVRNIRFNSYLNNKIVCDVDLYCQNIEYLVRFDKLNIMFKQLSSIYIDKELDSIYIDKELDNYFDWKCIASMLSMLDKINELKDSKLNQICIQYNHDMELRNWTQYQQLIHDKKWQLTIQDKVIKITR